MSNILIASVPIHGHVAPLLAVASGLIERGHHVRFLTGSRFNDSVALAGASFLPLPASADFDDRAITPRPDSVKGPIASIRHDARTLFLAPILEQYHTLKAVSAEPTDVVLVDPAFVGGLLLAGHSPAERPAIIGAGVLPLGLRSRYVAPFGLGIPPLPGIPGLIRNAFLNLVAEKLIFGSIQRDLDAIHRSVHGRDSGQFLFGWFGALDAVVQFSHEGFEYPRPDATIPIHFAGPVSSSSTGELPGWWSDLSGGKPVVVVTQGTVANQDLAALARPALEALANEDVLVVVTTGGKSTSDLGTLPANARAAEFLPYDLLLPLTSAMVTNGGYGGVQFALTYGVPIVIAGDTEDKPETAARVHWSGTGVNLRTGRPSADRIRGAVRQVLHESRYAANAAQAAEHIARLGGVDELTRVIDSLRESRLRSQPTVCN